MSDEKLDKENQGFEGESSKEILDVRSLTAEMIAKLNENPENSAADSNTDSDSNISCNTASTVALESTNVQNEG